MNNVKINTNLIKVAVVGIQGVPANYGGFESLVENLLGQNCPKNVRYTVFCSNKDSSSTPSSYKGAILKYIPLRANGLQSVLYDILSLCRSLRGYDAVLVLGVSGTIFLPIFRLFSRSIIIVNIDGLEHKRAKWGNFARNFLRFSEKMAVKYSDTIIADNKAIVDYVSDVYGKKSTLIAYGGDHVSRDLSDEFIDNVLKTYHLCDRSYNIAVCRIEPENNSRLVLEAFSKSNEVLVYIGNWNHSEYSRKLRDDYKCYSNIKMLDAIYDLDILYALRSRASKYIHGHSAGGTNPSLVEAMFIGVPILAYDVVYNRETTEGKAYFFKSADDLRNLLDKDLPASSMTEIANRRYRWKDIAFQYAQLYKR